jgi:hypothetical protein
VFGSGFSEGLLHSSIEAQSSSGSGQMTSKVPHRVVTITDDFDLFRALIFYLYTDKICFTTTPENFRSEFGDCPLISDGEGMYALAHRLLLDSITSKALAFIRTTCNIHMITTCVFGTFGSLYGDVGKLYYDFFMSNWSLVIKTPEFENFFAELEENPTEHIRVSNKFRDMVRIREESLAKGKK